MAGGVKGQPAPEPERGTDWIRWGGIPGFRFPIRDGSTISRMDRMTGMLLLPEQSEPQA